MDTTIIATYCLCDDLLRALHHQEDPQRRMHDAEVMTVAFVAVLHFRGNFESARSMLKTHGYIPYMLSRSRFLRRLYQIKELFLLFFQTLGELWKDLNISSIYSLDSFPIAVCDNIRIRRAKIYTTEEFRGYIASKKRYFYGVKIHLLITQDGHPVAFFLTPGSMGDVDALKIFDLDLPPGATVYGDKAYNDYLMEDILRDAAEIALLPMRKKNSKRPLEAWTAFAQHYYRKRVETTGSLLERLLPKSIHAVTPEGFELKVSLFIIAHSLSFCFSEG